MDSICVYLDQFLLRNLMVLFVFTFDSHKLQKNQKLKNAPPPGPFKRGLIVLQYRKTNFSFPRLAVDDTNHIR